MSDVDRTVDLELPSASERQFDPAHVHRLTIRGDQPQGWAHVVEFDGHQLTCSDIQISMSATGLVKAVITLPAVILDMDTNAITALVGTFMPRESV